MLKLTLLLSLLTLSQYQSQEFVNRATLAGSDQYLLYWNYTSTNITFKVIVKTLGWIGFGLSPSGGMANSDLIVAFQNPNGTLSFTNRYVGPVESLPVINPNQYWSLLNYSKLNGSTTLTFTRSLVICNRAYSINIVPGSQFVIFAWGDSFTTNSANYTDIGYHSPVNRGSSSLPLISTLNSKVSLNMTQIETREFIVNVTYIN